MANMIRRTSTAEAIVQHLVERIRGGEFGPGDRLPSERLLQTQLGVGRLSLREGLARLSALGIIRIDHGKGAFVEKRPNSESIAHAMILCFPQRDQKAMEDLVHARGLIEGELAAMAAAHRSDEDIVGLKKILESPGADRLDARDLAEVDFLFHLEVAKVADNDFLTVMLKALGNQIRTFLRHYTAAVSDPKRVIARHRPILQAIIDRDVEQARALAQAHVRVCEKSIQVFVKSKKTGTKSKQTPSLSLKKGVR
ncbi:FadR/GntR family transcriptional regulator [Planctomycetota bacterium]